MLFTFSEKYILILGSVPDGLIAIKPSSNIRRIKFALGK